MVRRGWEPAEAALSRALNVLSRLRCEYELSRVRLSLAYLALDSSPEGVVQIGRGEAADHLTRAMQTFERLGARVELLKALELAHRSEWLVEGKTTGG